MSANTKRFASLAYETNLRFFSSRRAKSVVFARALFSLKGKGGQTNKNSGGFSIVELIISISILGVLIVGVLAVFTNYFAVITRTNEVVTMTSESQNLLRIISEEIRYGAGVRTTNTITDANQPGGWNTSNTNFVIITAVPAVNSNEDYIIDPATGEPYINELVYYKSGSNMYKRVLAAKDSSGNLLAGNKLKTSCPPSIATSSCTADKKLLETGKTMAFTLYDQDDATTTDPLIARSVKIDLEQEKKVFGELITFNNSVRVTLRNTF